MIDVKTTKESLELLRFIKLPTDEQNNALSNVLGVVEQVLSAKVPTKYHVQENIIEETNVLSNRESARKGWNDCHDQFTALIARDYVYRDELPTEEELLAILRDNWNYWGDERKAKAIRDRIEKC